jgi:hypothetical protein
VWTWEVPLYFWFGGMAAGSSFVALACDLVGDERSAAVARKVAVAALLPSPSLLVMDLGRPGRFYKMLRVVKPRSPMSMGAWALTLFGHLAAASVGADLLGRRREARALALEALERLARIEVRVDDLRPRGRRARRDRPVRRAVVDDLAGLLEHREAVAAHARGVEVLHQAGRGGPGQADAGGADLAEREQPLAVPVGDEVEVLLARVLDASALDPRVEPLDVDELRAAAVGALRDRPDHVLLAGLTGDGDHLAGLHVGAEADDDVGEATERGVIHPSHLTRGAPCR